MRLINVKTLKLEKFLDNNLPPYAILSHTWKDDEELTLRDIEEGRTDKPGIGSIKLQRSCEQAKKDRLGYIWIDTCCIDKTDSVELGEAINSMFRWYKKANICYAYLLDVPSNDKPRSLESEFRKSRWFKRGWTLQELLAPKKLQFYNSEWRCLGNKGEMCNVVEAITGIPRQFLLGIEPLHKASVAQRMSWAAQRETTREEDIAYCLLGIFGVSLPMIYGEGCENAFFRLQEHIMKTTRDESILAWGLSLTDPISSYPAEVTPGKVLATSPSDFANCRHITLREQSSSPLHAIDISGGNLRIHLSLLTTSDGETIGLLKCGPEHEPDKAVGIPLRNTKPTSSDEYIRPRGSCSVLLPMVVTNTSSKLIYIKNDSQIEMSADTNQRYWLYNEEFAEINLALIDVSPRSCWDKERSLIVSTIESRGHTTYRTLARFRHIEEGSPDFITVLEMEQQGSFIEPQCYVMICSRDTSLVDLAENFRYMSQDVPRRRSASNGILGMHLTCESDARQLIILIRPHVTPNLTEVTFDATLELQKLGLRIEFAKLLEEDGQTGVESRELEQKVKEESTRLERTERELEVVEDELRKLIERKRILVECRENGAQEMVRVKARRTEIEKKQEDISKRLLYTQQRWSEIRSVDFNKDCFESEAMDCKTLLGWAAEYGHLDVVRLLLEKGADIKAAYTNGSTPLYSASKKGHLDVVQLLLEKGANIKAVSAKGWTPLKAASANGHVEIVKLLLEHGADVRVVSNQGSTPLNSASVNGHVKVVKLLLKHGADVTVANNKGLTPLHSASVNDHVKVVKLLLEHGADVTVTNNEGWTPLNSASRNGHVKIIKLLLEYGADVTVAVPNQKGWTPLNLASSNGDVELARLLLEHGADVEAKDSAHLTPLLYAAKHGNKAIIKLLLATARVDVDSTDYYNSTSLSIASRMGHKDVVAFLLTKSHALNVQDSFGRTALWWARRTGHTEIADLLLQKHKEEGIIVQEDDLPIAKISVPSNNSPGYCNICLLYISKEDTYYYCEVCNYGDFDICKECFVMKAHCLDKSHTLIQE